MSLANEPESGPAVEAVSLSETKEFARVTITEDDALILALIVFSRRFCEGRTGRVFVNQTWKEYFDVFPLSGEGFRLSKSPVSDVSTIKYYDADGVERTLANTVYQTDYVSEPMRIALAESQSWPEIQSGKLNAVTITFVAGYGAAASNVPTDWKIPIWLAVKRLYDFRETVIVGGQINEDTASLALDALLRKDKIWQF